MSKVILIRGNSGSGKPNVAKQLHTRLGAGNLLISQDTIRRELLQVKDYPNNSAIGLIETMVLYGLRHCEYTIIEGILAKDKYGEMLRRSLLLADESFVYYYDLTFEETIRRHQTKNKTNFDTKEMRSWFIEKDFLGLENEQLITEEVSHEQILTIILNDLTI
ncbi:P-loop NTPase family protein [Enterococcus sp. LJL99]